jgi:single-strand DNA-binding protein
MSDGSAEPLWGYIASEPDTKPTRQGKPRFFAFAGEPKYQDEPDGSRTRVGTEYRPLVAYGQVAEAAAAKFARGDNFIAIGYTRPYSYQKDGKDVSGEEFVALGIGHDSLRTNYEVDRSPRPSRNAASETPVAAAKRSREVPPEFAAPRASTPTTPTLAL